MSSPFAMIMQRAVERTPGAIGGAFADADGEMVDSFARGDTVELAVITAHYGVILQHLIACFGTWHYGGPEFFVAEHERLEIIVYAVDAGYYALIASRPPASVDIAIESLRGAARLLRSEMAL